MNNNKRNHCCLLLLPISKKESVKIALLHILLSGFESFITSQQLLRRRYLRECHSGLHRPCQNIIRKFQQQEHMEIPTMSPSCPGNLALNLKNTIGTDFNFCVQRRWTSSNVDSNRTSMAINKSINTIFHTSLNMSGPFLLTHTIPPNNTRS